MKIDGVVDEEFAYDANGNRLTYFKHDVGTVSATYDDQDRLLTYGTWTFTYTANGELETKTNTATGETWIFQYDALGNLVSVGLPNNDSVEYLVDGMGRRVGKKKNGVLLKQWIYRDALKPVAELDGAGNLVSEFVYGAKSNLPDYVVRGGATYRVLSDHLGSPMYAVNVASSADVPFTASYTSFGEVTGTGLEWMPFGFAGGHHDPDIRLTRFGARDYDVAVGRWSNKDPIRFEGGGGNLSMYAKNDPLNYVDTDGRNPAAILAIGELLCLQGAAIAGAKFADSFTRHCYASCIAARYCGYLPALGAGLLHEAGTGFSGDWREDLDADLSGANIGLLRFGDCENKCKKACPVP